MLAFPDHHSPSSIKQWRNSPLVWCLKYLYGWKDAGPKMWRGTAVEQGFAAHLRGSPFPVEIAHRGYLEESHGEVTDEIEAQKLLIQPMLRQAIIWHNTNNLELAATQIRIETRLDDVDRPFVGYVDFAFMDPPLDMDTKTTEACPSAPRPDDVRQVAIYEKARGRSQALLYLTPKKHAFYQIEPEQLDKARTEMSRAAQSLERFLELMPDRETAIHSLPQSDHFSVSQAAKDQLATMGV